MDPLGGEIDLPPTLPVLPIRGTVVFPLAMVPISVGQQRSVQMVEEVAQRDKLVAVVTQKNESATPPGPEDLYSVGTAGLIRQMHRTEAGTIQLILQGLQRVRLTSYVSTEPYPVAAVEPAKEVVEKGLQMQALVRTANDLYTRLAGLTPEMPDELAAAIRSFEDPLQISYLMATTAPFETPDRQKLLETDSVAQRFEQLIGLIQHQIAVRELEQKIAEQTKVRISESQKEYVLRERLRAIEEELGQQNGGEAQAFRKRIEELDLPEETRKEAERELSRLERMPEISPEFGMIRTWLDWLVSLPWGEAPEKPIDLEVARQTLDRDHYDLDKIKERLIDHLAVQKLKQERGVDSTPKEDAPGEKMRGEPILCFVGPPGTGKTSLGQSIAKALGRGFVRISLGGIHDESEIRGHRRTYIGAMPGRILQAMRRVKEPDPIFMLDEIDKLGAGFQGDPSAALLEVLDPAQNHAFVDTYLGVPVDLSRVLFICTANTTDPIPPALLDRMEVLRLSGYTDNEKLHIAKKFLIPIGIRANGLKPEEVDISDATIQRVIREYTREAGVRNLERELTTLIRKSARRIGSGEAGPIVIRPEDLHGFLGPRRYFDELLERVDRPGVVTGLAWTPTGGEILFVEAAMMPGRREELVLTGMLGDVMRESAQAALSLARSRARHWGIDADDFVRKVVHLHVPAGAIPKDGPSAGVAMFVALVSLVSGRTVRPDVAMTGEITLRGKVLPVGGIRDKVLAAYRAGIRQVLIPKRNEVNLEDVPEEVRKAMTFVGIDSVETALAHAMIQEPMRHGEEEPGPTEEHEVPGGEAHQPPLV